MTFKLSKRLAFRKKNTRHEQGLIPILLAGAGRTGSTALMSLLSSDPRVALDRWYPFESRYLSYFLKFGMFIQRPDFFPFLDGEKLFDSTHLGITAVPGARPGRRDVAIDLLQHSADGRLISKSNGAVVEVEGSDFWIILPFETFDAHEVKEVWVSIRGEIGDVFSLYWKAHDTDFSESRSLHVDYSPLGGGGSCVFAFRVYEHAGWSGTISQVRLDLFNSTHTPHRGRGFIRWVRLVA
jgi:hypothetical protein